jgi:hypothetical protein
VNNTQSYDAELQMFRSDSSVNLAHLQFLRWLSEQGRLEHAPVSLPSGKLARAVVEELRLTSSAR